MPLLPAGKTLPHTSLPAASSWPFTRTTTKRHAVTLAQMALGPARAGQQERQGKSPRMSSLRATRPDLEGEVQSTVYSGAITQTFAGCSAMIKQRGFQRMRSVCDSPGFAVSTPRLQYQVTARSKIIVVRGRQGQNSSSFSKWKGFMVLQSTAGMWGITQGPHGDQRSLPQVLTAAVLTFSCENKQDKLVIKGNLCVLLLSPQASCTGRL